MIESKSNSKIKLIASLSTKKGRRENGKYLIEGSHMVLDAVKYGIVLSEIFVSESVATEILPKLSGAMCDITIVKDAVFNSVAKTENTQGILAIANIPAEEPFYAGNRFLVLDHIQDPGNIGTIVRTAAATGYSEIILIDCVDPFNPKAVRSSSSGVFFVKFHHMTENQVIDLVKSFDVIAASAEGENVFESIELPKRFGLVIGNEAKGVSEKLRKTCKLVALPMDERVESLNAAVSASVLMYVLQNR